MSKSMGSSVARVQEFLRAAGLEARIVETPATTRTAVEAAQTLGTTVAQIVKSLVFRGKVSGRAYLVVASGVNRVSELRLQEVLGEPVVKADADFVREVTGFAIGGVPPVAHLHRLETVVDADLMQLDEMFAAAGSPHHIFRLTPQELRKMVVGRVAVIKA
jgi:prolyl-tRNA editing enzyme YbaK/EbsC (Cys-tRNA(Pro) deacylase)